jgi:spore coat polysaccharide biosynthesis protein SpsF (cytidylyltransferase family)
MASTRLPGKTLYPIAGKPLFDFTLRFVSYLKKAGIVDDAVLCTTHYAEDDVLVAWADQYDIPTSVRGEPHRLWDWHLEAAKDWDYCMRVCADQPLVDYELAEALVERVVADPGADYYGYLRADGAPAVQTYYGLTTDVFRMGTALRAGRDAHIDQEHTTATFYTYPDKFDLRWLMAPQRLQELGVAATVDTAEDAARASKIVNYVRHQSGGWPPTSSRWIHDWFEQNPNEQVHKVKDYDGPRFIKEARELHDTDI